MMKKLISQFNILAQCRKYGISLWQCPQFLFLIMGLIIIGGMLASYVLGNYYLVEPEIVALIVLAIAFVLVAIAFTVARNFERLAEVNRMKSEFIGVVSHQLRSPLSNLKWALEILLSGRMGPTNEKQIEYFTILQENSKRMNVLITDLLTVSRLETAKLRLNKEQACLTEITKNVVSDFEPLIKMSNANIVFHAEQDLPKILVDISQMKLVVGNLLDNAMKYTKDKREIKISLSKKDKAVLFEITDSGAGIPNQDKKHIFKKFFRSSNALKYQTQGSGLGLYIAKAIIKRSGGRIGFRSQENKGSTFWFSLPIT